MRKEVIIKEKVTLDISGTFQNLDIKVEYREEQYNLYWSLLSGIEIPYELTKIKDEIIKVILEFLSLEKI